MEHALKQPDPTEVVAERALSLPEQARAIEIRDDAGFASAGEFLLGVKALRAEINSVFDPILKRAFDSHREAVAGKRRVEAPVAEAETIAKRGMAEYQAERECRRREAEAAARRERERAEAEERRKADEERARLEREAEERRLAEAVEAEERGDAEAAEQILEAPPEPVFVPEPPAVFTPPPMPEPTKVEGVSFREKWVFAVTNPSAVPREYLAVDEKKIGAVVRAMKGETKIPGVRVWAESTVAAKAR